MPTSYTANSKSAAIAKAILGTCRPCCGTGSGGGAGSGIPLPCEGGCAGCNCCPGVCWWATQWHRAWNTFSPRYATGAVTPAYNMTNYSMSLVSNPNDYYYFGDIASDDTQCTIGGAVPVNGACNTGDPLHILTGTVEWTLNVAPFTVHSYTIDYYLDLTVQWECGVDFVSSTYNGFYKDGIQYSSGDPTFDSFQSQADYALAINTNTDEVVETSTCGFTLDLSLLRIPNITLIPIS